ncbi:MAG TPA: hypothetical protein PKE27_10090 [Povalibacter sp.]|uniref:hypothetical protein n=1 Tax=Povalibacter sp. TaxID=1962978 RepID=UPI002C0AA205|nr:hypothetical protein [Povalibacter sp.]HMN44914.1 hypothetical protein [Povalibacter sp.]
MKKPIWFAALMLIVAGAFSVLQAADGSRFAGKWTGTWEGGGSGGSLVLTIAAGADAGEVAVGQDTGDYTATFASVSVADDRLTIRYPYTPDPQADILLTGTFAGDSASGEWNMVAKGESTSFASGTWTVKR